MTKGSCEITTGSCHMATLLMRTSIRLHHMLIACCRMLVASCHMVIAQAHMHRRHMHMATAPCNIRKDCCCMGGRLCRMCTTWQHMLRVCCIKARAYMHML